MHKMSTTATEVLLKVDKNGETFVHVNDNVFTLEELEKTYTREQCLSMLTSGFLLSQEQIERGIERKKAEVSMKDKKKVKQTPAEVVKQEHQATSLMSTVVQKIIHSFGASKDNNAAVSTYFEEELRRYLRDLLEDLVKVVDFERKQKAEIAARKEAELEAARRAENGSTVFFPTSEAVLSNGTDSKDIITANGNHEPNTPRSNMDSAVATPSKSTPDPSLVIHIPGHLIKGGTPKTTTKTTTKPPTKTTANKNVRVALRHLRWRFQNVPSLLERVNEINAFVSSFLRVEAQIRLPEDDKEANNVLQHNTSNANNDDESITPAFAATLFGGTDESSVWKNLAMPSDVSTDEGVCDNVLCTTCNDVRVQCHRCRVESGAESRTMRRLRYRDAMTKNMGVEDYEYYMECATTSLTRPVAQLDAFKVWLGLSHACFDGVIFSKEVLDIVGEIGADWLEDVVRLSIANSAENSNNKEFMLGGIDMETAQVAVEAITSKEALFDVNSIVLTTAERKKRKGRQPKAKKTPKKKEPKKPNASPKPKASPNAKTPAKKAPKKSSAVKRAKTTRAEKEATKELVTEESPIKEATQEPILEAPAEMAPIEEAPAKQTRAKRTVSKKAPITTTVATEAPALGRSGRTRNVAAKRKAEEDSMVAKRQKLDDMNDL